MARKIEVQILGDSASLEKALGRAAKKTSGFSSAMKTAAKGGALALGGLGIAAKIGFDELGQGQKVAAQTAAVLKSTGGAANVTAGQVQKLANALLQKTGVDDEAIASGENLLLTFRNVRNEAGKGNDVFNQATKASLDLSVAMGTDMHTAALQVGKALNDPIKGLTALRRVGVGFSSDQEQMIKHLVKTGHTMQAQKVILGELRKEFGGSAEAAGKTLPGQLSILQENLRNLAASLTQALLPALQGLVGGLSAASGWMQRNQTATKAIVGVVGTLSAAFIVAAGANALWNSSLVAMIGQERIAAVSSRILSASLMGIPVIAIAAGIIALGAALVVAYRKSETFRHIVNGAFHAVQAVAGAVVGFIRGHWQDLITFIPVIGLPLRLVMGHWNTLKSGVVKAVQTIKSWAGQIADKVRSVADAAAGPLGRIAGFFQTIIDKVSSVVSWIGRIHFPSPPSWLTGGLLGHLAAGTSFAKGGLALVGERGPEIVRMPRGAAVYTAAATRGMMRSPTPMAAGGGGGRMVIENVIVLDGHVVARSVKNVDTHHRRQNGGRGLFEKR